jgi:hypothetical protein
MRQPATVLFDVLYCLALEDSKEHADRRAELDGRLASTEKPHRETWGRLPHQQEAMRRAEEAAS